ncbi:MAG: peptidylprolyl isomerase [Myxococcota bacterium]
MRFAAALGLAALLCAPALACTRAPGDTRSVANKRLLDPANANATAPDVYRVKFETTKGDVLLEVRREWAPRGADRFYNLVTIGYFEEIAFFRAIDGFMVQFGLHGTPAVTKVWKKARIPDDERTQSNRRGTVSFANSGPDTRTTQVFINFRDNTKLDRMGFTPFATVVEGMDVVDALYKGYGEGAPSGTGPDQMEIEKKGNRYLQENFPKLDWLNKASIAEG